MWLRAVRAAERGQDGGIGIAGKSPPNLVLAPDRGLLVLPAENPVRPTPKPPSMPTSPGLPTPSALPGGALPAKPLTLRVPASPWRGSSSLPSPILAFTSEIPSLPLSSSRLRCQDLATRQLFFPLAPYSLLSPLPLISCLPSSSQT